MTFLFCLLLRGNGVFVFESLAWGLLARGLLVTVGLVAEPLPPRARGE